MADRPSTPNGPKAPTGTGLSTPATRDRAAVRPSNAPAPVDGRSKTKDLFVTAPKLEVPKGGGAVKGIGEKFQANPVTGTSSFSVPIALSPGRQGFTPGLSLAYDSGSGNGPFGLGWSVGVPSITRKTDRGLPRYRDAEDSDVFVISDAEDLVPFQAWSGTAWAEPTLEPVIEGSVTYSRRRYRPRVEAGFARIERWTNTSTKATHWRTWSKENIRRIYGMDATGALPSDGDSESVTARANGRLVDPDCTSHVFRWYLQEERDELGNLIRYEYAQEDRAGAAVTLAERMRTLTKNHCAYTYLKRVLYGNVTPGSASGGWLFEVVFDYGEHAGDGAATPPTAPVARPASPLVWTTRPDVFSNFRSGFDVRCYRLCTRILMFHRFEDPTSDTGAVIVRSTELAHSDPEVSAVATTLTAVTHRGWRYDAGTSTWTTQAMPRVEFGYGQATIDTSVKFVTGLDDLPNGLDTSRWQWTDLDGEGLTGLMSEQGGQWFYKRNEGQGAMGPARIIRTRPSLAALNDPQCRLMDVDGDGRQEIVSLRPGLAGSYARDPSTGEWQGFKPFTTMPTTSLNDPNVRLLDIDGDGLADVLLTEDDCFTWYPSEGRDGWSKAEQRRKEHDEDYGPTLVFSSQSETIFLADMTGDGLTDIVRVRNGNVSYWPNRGYGRFGGKIFMGKSPWFDSPDRFDPKRIRFADVDGSGPADLLYLGPKTVTIWANESGNRWSITPTALPEFPGVEDAASIQVSDLLGDGTACLVWSSPLMRDAWRPLRYVHLMGDGKPYLLKTITNNLGRTTTLSYAPSTQFYIADRRAGTPWATRLPFPVQVLETVTVEDAVTGWSNTTTYAYHHGYHDSDEREFRGFGKVEQWDTEAAPSVTVGQLPPVRTVTWFHTGAWRQHGTLEDAYGTEYFAGDIHAFARTPCAVGIADGDSSALRAREQREAYRALKGRPLRQEVYAEDANVPYTVTETSFTASRLQRADNDHHGSFLVTPLQTLTYHYERNATDPRIQQQCTLEVDAYGTVVRALTAAYPRRASASPDAGQTTGVALVTRTEVIHDDLTFDASPDSWHLAVPVRVRSWHVVPTSSTFFDGLVTADAITALLPAAAGGTASTTVIDFAADPPSGVDYLRKVADKLTTYDDAGTELAAGMMGALALPYQAYQLAYTAPQATALDALLAALIPTSGPTVLDQGYIELTGLAFSGIDDVAGAWARSGTQSRDSAHFYVPTSFTDPFGSTTSVTWHSSYLFAASVTDPLGNVVAVTYDTVALLPLTLTDPNRNLTQARYDALGRVTAIARASDTGDGETDLDNPSQTFSYDLTVIPAQAYGAVRDLHASETGTPNWIETYAYSDGAGNVVMQKATAAPDVSTPTVARWVGSGRVVLNNKGLPIKQYEPFFAASASFEAEEGFGGVTPIITYDPVGRPIRVDLPNGTLRKVTFNPWSQATYDENDTIDESTAASGLVATVPTDHRNTPTTVFLDVQGRPYKTQELLAAAGTPLTTTLTLDVMGNPTAVTDARANVATTPWATQAQTFDMLGRPILTSSADGGDATALLDVGGNPRFVWKSGDLCEEAEYDALRRRVRTWEWAVATPGKTLRERFVYGESLYAVDNTATTEVNEAYDPRDDDLRGRLYRVWDGAGTVVSAYDWKGNPVSSIRRFCDDDEAMPAWTVAGAYPFAGDDAAGVAAFDDANDSLLGTGTDTNLASFATFDALDRVVTATAPDDQVTSNGYDAGGRLITVDVGTTHYVTAITYNARGQRLSISYGNSVETAYTYEPDTFRLATLVTTRPDTAIDADYPPLDDVLQNLSYAYDPVGNIVGIADAAQEVYYTDNTTVTPNQAFVYDALYRLTSATGREKGDRLQPWSSDPATLGIPASGTQIRNYTETYTYDPVGNIATMQHVAPTTSTNWTRTYLYESGSNRLSSTTEAEGTKTYAHDERGSVTYLPWLNPDAGLTPNVETTFRDQMRKAYLNSGGDTAFYFYDSAGQRVRKVVKTGGVQDRRYVGSYEVWTQKSSGVVNERRTTLSVMDGQSRVAMIETRTRHGGADVTEGPVIRYQLGNHLGTSCIELDGAANVISYEEYHPYGSTAWWSSNGDVDVSLKRYRYTGMERDEETGLQCHGVRYYATWLGRWTSADPIGLGDGVNRFAYCHGGPVGGRDSTGLADWDWNHPIDSLEAKTMESPRVALTVWALEGVASSVSGFANAPTDALDQANAEPESNPLGLAVNTVAALALVGQAGEVAAVTKEAITEVAGPAIEATAREVRAASFALSLESEAPALDAAAASNPGNAMTDAPLKIRAGNAATGRMGEAVVEGVANGDLGGSFARQVGFKDAGGWRGTRIDLGGSDALGTVRGLEVKAGAAMPSYNQQLIIPQIRSGTAGLTQGAINAGFQQGVVAPVDIIRLRDPFSGGAAFEARSQLINLMFPQP